MTMPKLFVFLLAMPVQPSGFRIKAKGGGPEYVSFDGSDLQLGGMLANAYLDAARRRHDMDDEEGTIQAFLSTHLLSKISPPNLPARPCTCRAIVPQCEDIPEDCLQGTCQQYCMVKAAQRKVGTMDYRFFPCLPFDAGAAMQSRVFNVSGEGSGRPAAAMLHTLVSGYAKGSKSGHGLGGAAINASASREMPFVSMFSVARRPCTHRPEIQCIPDEDFLANMRTKGWYRYPLFAAFAGAQFAAQKRVLTTADRIQISRMGGVIGIDPDVVEGFLTGKTSLKDLQEMGF